MSTLDVLFSFKGRISRSEFWLKGYLPLCLPGLLIALLLPTNEDGHWNLIISPGQQAPPGYLVGVIVLLGMIWPMLAIYAKRLHDRNYSGMTLILCAIPIVCLFAWIWAFTQTGFMKGTFGPNKYGDDPLGDQPQPDSIHVAEKFPQDEARGAAIKGFDVNGLKIILAIVCAVLLIATGAILSYCYQEWTGGVPNSGLSRDRKIQADFDQRMSYLVDYSEWPQLSGSFYGLDESVGDLWFADYKYEVDKAESIAFPYTAKISYTCYAMRSHLPRDVNSKRRILERLEIGHVTTLLHYGDADSEWSHVSTQVDLTLKEGTPFLVACGFINTHLLPDAYAVNARDREFAQREVQDTATSIWTSSDAPCGGMFHCTQEMMFDAEKYRKSRIDNARADGDLQEAFPVYMDVQ